jgi:hypothetical protein
VTKEHVILSFPGLQTVIAYHCFRSKCEEKYFLETNSVFILNPESNVYLILLTIIILDIIHRPNLYLNSTFRKLNSVSVVPLNRRNIQNCDSYINVPAQTYR